jgi:hypothetical protein
MKINIDRIAATKDCLAFGLVIRYADNGPVRFAQVQLDDDVLDWATLQGLAEYVVRQTNRHLDREREIQDDLPLPGM